MAKLNFWDYLREIHGMQQGEFFALNEFQQKALNVEYEIYMKGKF